MYRSSGDKRILTGKARLAQRRALRVLALLRASPCDTCSRPEKCALAVQKALKQLDLARLELGLHDGLVLDSVSGWLWTGGVSERLCEKCTAAQNKAHDRLRWETWCALPEIFDVEVPQWPKVSDMPQVEDGTGGEGEDEDEDEDEAEVEGEGGNT
ncbi:hypothetical protein BD413DRAFT_589885 [Trametes elegans]|nr:hypothetical protein BD413DRAFT_589885 [Trametes elegans]